MLGKITKFGQRNEFSDNKMSTNRSEMGKPDKVNTKVASSRTRSKTTALKKASSGSDRTDNNELRPDEEDWMSAESDDDMDVNEGVELIMSMASGNNITTFTEHKQEDTNISELYSIGEKIYRYGMSSAQHPTLEGIRHTISQLATNVELPMIENQILTQVIEPRNERESVRTVPEFLTLFETWVMEATRDKTDTTPEAYITLGVAYKLAEQHATTWWTHSATIDNNNIKTLLNLNINNEDIRVQALAMLDECHREEMAERMRAIDVRGRDILHLLDGVAEEKAMTQLPSDVEPATEIRKFIAEHNKGSNQWVQAARKGAKAKQTSDSTNQLQKNQRVPLPPMARGPIAVTRTLYEETTEVEQDKLRRAYRQQRGREHAINPIIKKTKWLTENAETITAKETMLDNLTTLDDTTFSTRIVQIVGLKLPKVLEGDIAINSNTTVKSKLRREMDTILKKAGHDNARDLNERCHTPNHWALDEEWFESNWSTLHNQGDATYQADTIYMVLKTRVYFAPVGTFGTTQIDDQGREVPYGNQGSGRCIFDMCQVITSDHDYTQGLREYRNYRQYTVIGMPSTCKVEMVFHKKSGPLLTVYRGLYQEMEHQTSLAIQILAITQHMIELGVPASDFGIIIEQNWHGMRKYTSTGEVQAIPRLHNDNKPPSNKRDNFAKDREYKVEKRTELIAKVCYCGEVKGLDAANTPMYRKYRDTMSKDVNDTGQYVNLRGLRMERFLTIGDMHDKLTHTIEADTPHVTVIDNLADHVRARDVLEELLADNTHTNWHNVPNMTCCYIQPSSNVAWAKHGTQLICVWRHELVPIVLNEESLTEAETAAQIEYERCTNHHLELQNLIDKYSGKSGGVTYTMMDIDPRSRWVELGKLHSKKKIARSPVGTPEKKDSFKKARIGGTPERSLVRAQRTPLTNDTVSSSITRTNSDKGSVERYEKPDSVIMSHLAKLSQDMSRLTTEIEQIQSRTTENEIRHVTTESAIQELATKLTLTQSKNLKKILQQVRSEADNLSDANRKVEIYQKQLSKSASSTETEYAHIQATLEIAQLDAKRCARTLDDLRDEAKDQAELDGVMLTENDLAYVE